MVMRLLSKPYVNGIWCRAVGWNQIPFLEKMETLFQTAYFRLGFITDLIITFYITTMLDKRITVLCYDPILRFGDGQNTNVVSCLNTIFIKYTSVQISKGGRQQRNLNDVVFNPCFNYIVILESR